MEPIPLWCISKPYDTLLLKYWPFRRLNDFKDSLVAPPHSEIIEALVPNKNRENYLRNEILLEIFDEFYKSPNLCDRFKFCQNVMEHSTGLACVTAASIRKRLHNHFPERLGTLLNKDFQYQVFTQSNMITKRDNIGVLVFDCQNDDNALRRHAMEVFYENFFLYTTPMIDQNIAQPNVRRIKHFILKQIARNTDCVVIFVDQIMINRLCDRKDIVKDILMQTIIYDYKIKIIIISLCPEADDMATVLFEELILLRPVIVMYDQFIMAPTGGLIALIKNSSKLSYANAFLKYWYRGWNVFYPSTLQIADVPNAREDLVVCDDLNV